MGVAAAKQQILHLKNILSGQKIAKKQENQKKESALHDFRATKAKYIEQTLEQGIRSLKSEILRIDCEDSKKQVTFQKILQIAQSIHSSQNHEQLIKDLETLSTELNKIPEEQPTKKNRIFVGISFPQEIREEMLADISELEKCFSAGCFRSAIILSGRLLEAALHRKYYEITGQDILETNPGMGLGKLIAKLDEHNVKFDPGLTQQIHLINQARICSVHKKQETFYPTAKQTEAVMLYTSDALYKLFST